MRDCCVNCDHSDVKRTNELGQIRCKKFSTYVNPSADCDYYFNAKEDEELASWLMLKESEQND